MPFFDLGSMELLLIGIVALIVVGPKDLPKLMRAAGQAMNKVRGAARHFKSGIDEMVRQSELDEMQKKWDAHNKAIMADSSASEKAKPGDFAADSVPAEAPNNTRPNEEYVPVERPSANGAARAPGVKPAKASPSTAADNAAPAPAPAPAPSQTSSSTTPSPTTDRTAGS
jgi:sec-independent protein translocase protein TatB|tara:strand:- start:100463 stop:100972 length:510 start_codon:yes stop_codon:yes gene_type:complete